MSIRALFADQRHEFGSGGRAALKDAAHGAGDGQAARLANAAHCHTVSTYDGLAMPPHKDSACWYGNAKYFIIERFGTTVIWLELSIPFISFARFSFMH